MIQGSPISVTTSTREIFPKPVDDPLWRIEVTGHDRLRERELESWLTVGNGRTGTRGSLEEAGAESNPAVYVAGVYGHAPDGTSGPMLLRGPLWISLDPHLADTPVCLEDGEVVEHRRILDLRHGLLFRIWRQRLPDGRVVDFRSVRFASLADRSLAAMRAVVHSAEGVPLRLDGEIRLAENASFQEAVAVQEQDRLRVELHGTRGGRALFAVATEEHAGTLERIVTFARAASGGDYDSAPEEHLRWARSQGLPELQRRHEDAWRERWRASDVVVEGDRQAQTALRFALYHLISSADPDYDLASIGARGLTGPGYDGHVFWDTDVFMLPFFLHTHPQVARRLLGYRHRTLPAARARARSLGYRGALYAWESADTGEDCTPELVVALDGSIVPVLTGLEEHHISADVAWAAWRYWEATQDFDFLRDMGAEIVLDTARFWASRTRRGRNGAHHIGPVIGPDEYHEGVRDNAYTNLLARWNLERGVELAALLSRADPECWRSLSRRLRLQTAELTRWHAVARTLVHRVDPATLVLEQMEGYFQLENILAVDLAPRPFAGDVVLGKERLRQSQVIKQADVVMLTHLLPELFTQESTLANYRYYEPRTSHGSSLSPAVHAVVAARLGLSGEALAYFRMAASVDLDDRMGNAAQGIHMAAAGGLWQAAVFGFGGVRPELDTLRIDPRLPDDWTRLSFPFTWRGQVIRVDSRRSELEFELGSNLKVAVGLGAGRLLAAGRYRSLSREGAWSPPERIAG